MSLIAVTCSVSGWRSSIVRRDCRPIRPNPLIPILTGISIPSQDTEKQRFCLLPTGYGSPLPHAAPVPFQQVPPDEPDVAEDADAERDDRPEVDVHAEEVADRREQRGEERVREEPGEEDRQVEAFLQLGAQAAEDGVQRGEDSDRG